MNAPTLPIMTWAECSAYAVSRTGAFSQNDNDGGKLTQFGPDGKKMQCYTVGKYTGVDAVLAINDKMIIYGSKDGCVVCSQ